MCALRTRDRVLSGLYFSAHALVGRRLGTRRAHGLHGPDELPVAFVALLLCSCRRSDRVTTRLIAAIEPSGVLCDSDLDELAESLLSHELVISYPLTWISPQWLDIDLSAARRALRADPTRLDDLLSAAEGFQPRHRDALIHGLLDAADVLDKAQRCGVVRRGLQTAQASVRRTALDRLCELDGPQKAVRRARSDSNATVRKWRPQSPQGPGLFQA